MAPDAAPQSTPVTTPHRWWALAAVALGVSLIIMDATIVNVALPVVIQDIGLTATQAEWMNAVYSLMFAALLLTSGRAGDLWGRRRMLLIGMAIFVAASVVAGSVDTGEALIAARLVQGIGAALIMPATLSTVNAVFVGRERAIAFAVWGSTIGGMAAVGPLVGGWLATDVTWRWAFWLNVPVGLVVIALALWAVPETREADARGGLDLRGAALSALGMGAIVFALIEGGQYGWWLQDSGAISPVPLALAGGLLVMAWFVRDQLAGRRAGRAVLVDLTLLRLRSFRYGSIAALVVALGEFGLLFTLPLLLQNAMGYTALGTGWLILFLAVGTFLVSGATPQLTARLGARAVVRMGLAAEAIAVGGLAVTLSSDLPGAAIAAWLFLYGAGVGMATAQLTNVILVDVPVAQSGQASGLQSTFRQVGSALGVAILGTLLMVSLGRATDAQLTDAGLPSDVRAPVVEQVRGSAGVAIPALQADPATEAEGDAAAEAMITASRITTGVAAGVILLGLAATLALPAPAPASSRRDDEDGAEGESEGAGTRDGEA
ncbi:MFS transporter [Demequina sp. NBRC 110055]|uniref:MFS transporter n=1 Tax=Demequina sp. NBRC 110055 TaxID=1570344 RepID=UPI000A0771FA|nr:MFS transporter [Demequina sp. NBRC 110055]